MSPRLIAFVLGLALAAPLAVWGLRASRPERRPIGFHLVDAAVLEEASREASGRREELAFRVPLDEATVLRIMPVKGPREYDPHCYFRYKPNLEHYREWEEHPDGGFARITNSLGLRMDEELLESPPDLRVLVLGDSHIGGVCANAEAFAARLEDGLRAADPERSVEVINGAHGAYTFYHYLGVLERMLHLDKDPDLVLMVVYGGNDFSTGLWHLFHGTQRFTPPAAVGKRKRDCARLHPKAMGQVLNTLEYFTHAGPEEVELAHTAANTLMAAIKRQCDVRGIELRVVFLPSPSDVPDQVDMESIHAGLEVLELERSALELITQMGDRLLVDLAACDVATFDLRPVFRRQTRELFWRTDMHLNLEGHALMADSIGPWVEEWWAQRKR